MYPNSTNKFIVYRKRFFTILVSTLVAFSLSFFAVNLVARANSGGPGPAGYDYGYGSSIGPPGGYDNPEPAPGYNTSVGTTQPYGSYTYVFPPEVNEVGQIVWLVCDNPGCGTSHYIFLMAPLGGGGGYGNGGSGGGGSSPSSLGNFNLSNDSAACNSVPLSWTSSSGAQAYRILEGNPLVDISPYQPYTALNFTDTTVSQNTTYQYQIEAYNGASTNRSNTINVTTPYCPPTVNLSGDQTSIFQGQSSTLTWSSTNATSCIASGSWSGSKALNGSEIVFPSPPPSATYSLSCSGLGGSVGPQSVTINITPLALPDWREIIPR